VMVASDFFSFFFFFFSFGSAELGRSGKPDNGRGEQAKRALPSNARRLQVDRV
jgi:hypothetical protein